MLRRAWAEPKSADPEPKPSPPAFAATGDRGYVPMTAVVTPAPAAPATVPTPDLSAVPADVAERPVLFFDGVCGLCSGAVDFLIARDPVGVLRFAPLQGETAARALPGTDTESVKYMVLLDDAGRSVRTAAVVRALSHLGGRCGCWRLGGLWLDAGAACGTSGYRARGDWSRYRGLGAEKRAAGCRRAEERGRFLP